ncbi:MAG: GNAT family N-acetyltransferase [candidate division SR1 bacterium]|nr:GNAT family N-acetyltransferase [candidate division SR1 bacterium]
MKEIIQPIDKGLILGELSKQEPVRITKRLSNEIYIISATACPQIMLEIGRLRELTFRAAGGGTGKEVDIDEYDYLFKHIVLWDPKIQEIVGSYRYALMKDLVQGQNIQSPTGKLFNFSEKFIREYLSKTIELGRSFVQPKYQPRVDNKSGIFSLFNLFSGLEYLVSTYPEIQYFFGKFTMYSTYDVRARNLLLSYLRRKFPDPDKLVRPKKDVRLKYVRRNLMLLQSIFNQQTFKDQKKSLEAYLSKFGEYIQPLVDTYMSLSSTMKILGTAKHEEFGETEETGLLVNILDIHPEVIERFRSNVKD